MLCLGVAIYAGFVPITALYSDKPTPGTLHPAHNVTFIPPPPCRYFDKLIAELR